jgi:hypothetical protein
MLTNLLSVLDYVHSKNIVHFDIKPENIYLCDDGRVLLLDFGISKILSRIQSMSTAGGGGLRGTLLYASPEQHSREIDDDDYEDDEMPKVDVWGCGAVALEALTGARIIDVSLDPHSRAYKKELALLKKGEKDGQVWSVEHVLGWNAAQEPRVPTLWDAAPEELRQAIRRCLVNRHGDRPHVASLLQEPCVTALKRMPVPAPSPRRPSVFLSYRMAEATEQTKEVQRLLIARGVDAIVVICLPGVDLHQEVASRLYDSQLVVMFGTATYGRKTVSFSTYEEMLMTLSMKKPFFLIRMCPEFEEPAARLALPSSLMYTEWLPGAPMPPSLVDDIVARLRDVTSGAGAGAGGGGPGNTLPAPPSPGGRPNLSAAPPVPAPGYSPPIHIMEHHHHPSPTTQHPSPTTHHPPPITYLYSVTHLSTYPYH